MSTLSFDTALFDTAYQSFLQQLQSYNTLQRKHLYTLFQQNLKQLLHTYAAPKSENGVQNTVDNTVNLTVIEHTIAHKLYTIYGEHVNTVFTRFDTKHTGYINIQQLHAVTALLGLNLYTNELQTIMQKYISNDSSGVMSYTSMLQYYAAEKSNVQHSTQTDMYNSILLNRAELTSAERDGIVRIAIDSTTDKLQQCMSVIRQYCYTKNTNLYQLYKSMCSNGSTSNISVDSVVESLYKQFDFIHELVTQDELKSAAIKYCSNSEQTLSYKQFVDFIQGTDVNTVTTSAVSVNERAQIMQQCTEPLIKINALNVRKYFKALDSNMDGLLTVQDIINGLVEHGLNKKYVDNPLLSEWILSFPHKTTDQFSYAEYLQFTSQRLQQNGHTADELNLMQCNPTTIDSTLSVSDVFSTIMYATRHSHISVESVLQRYSATGTELTEIELYNGISALGFIWTNESCSALFNAFISELGTATINIHEFVQTLTNPNRLHQLSIKSGRQPAGGQSTVPLGSYVDPNIVAAEHKPIRKHIEVGECTEEIQYHASRTHVEPSVKSTIDLSHNDTVTNKPIQPSLAPESTFSFVAPEPPQTPKVQQSEKPSILAFDPQTPIEPIHKRLHTAGGKTSICLTDVIDIEVKPTVPTPKHKTSDIFSTEPVEPTVRSSIQVHTEAGKSSIVFGDDTENTVQNKYTPREQDKTHIFDTEPEIQQNTVRKQVNDKRKSSLQIGTSGTHMDVPVTPRVRKLVSGHSNSETIHVVGDQTDKLILDTYKSTAVDTIDYPLLEQISTAIYQHSQRIKHTFQEFNKGNATTLSKQNFMDGVNNQLKIQLSEEQATAIYNKFDTDRDDAINYSEFVRLLSTKPEPVTVA